MSEPSHILRDAMNSQTDEAHRLLELAKHRIAELEAELELYTQRARELANLDCEQIKGLERERNEARKALLWLWEDWWRGDSAPHGVVPDHVRAAYLAARAAGEER